MNKVPLLTFLACCVVSTTASAQEPFTKETFEVGGQVAYGFYVGQGDPNPYKFGLGANAGYTFASNLFVGARFDYFFGGDEDTLLGEVSSNFLSLMGVLGYDIEATSAIVVRPQAGVGVLWTRGDVCTSGGCQDLGGDGEFAIAPGVKGLLRIAGPVYIAGEVSYYNVFSERNVDGLALAIGAGGRF